MGERDNSRRSKGGEVVEAPINPLYDELFGKILEVSRLRGESSTVNAATVAIQILPDKSMISVTVNPCFADEQESQFS